MAAAISAVDETFALPSPENRRFVLIHYGYPQQPPYFTSNSFSGLKVACFHLELSLCRLGRTLRAAQTSYFGPANLL
jgi:hypothetical protein